MELRCRTRSCRCVTTHCLIRYASSWERNRWREDHFSKNCCRLRLPVTGERITTGATVSAPHKSPSCRDERLVAFLQSASSYPHRPQEVRLIQTHISWVFIASPFVFKVKK